MRLLVLSLIAIYIQTVTPAPNSRIIGGFPAPIHQYPFAAAIDVQTSGSKFFCGGTIYTRQFVITAGQCVDSGNFINPFRSV
ncbi:hypothetical protein MTP99_009563 [Tenebrio molitor]|nr:hypothetical protein MTP99_009563 [Tenebrio molitor]